MRKTRTWITAVVLLPLLSGVVFGEDSVKLENGVPVKGDVAVSGQSYVFDVPGEVRLLTIAVRSQKQGDQLALYVNAPDRQGVPVKGNATYASDGGWEGGNNESVAVSKKEDLPSGQYRIRVEKKGKEACEYEIEARFQQSQAIELDKAVLSTTADDKVNGAKYFHFDLDDDYDFLDIFVTSETKNNGLDLYLNTPSAEYHPDGKSHEFASRAGWEGGNQEWIFIDPPAKPAKGRYRLSVLQPASDRCPQFRLTVSAEKIPVLANNKRVKKATRRKGEFFYFDVPEGASKVTIATESIVKENILDLYVNEPIDEAFPTVKAFRHASRNGWAEGAVETIEIDDPEPGRHYIWVANLSGGKDYIIRAAAK